MRIVLRVAIALVVLFVLGLVGLALALPRIASSDAVRARIERAAADATGAKVGFDELSFGVLPPRLVVTEPRVSAAASGGDPVAQAERVDLELSLLPLLARTVVVDSLVIEGAKLRLLRTRDGIELPLGKPAAPAAPPGAAPKPPAEAAPPAQPGPGFALAVGSLELRRTQVVLEDRSTKPPVVWEVQDLDARARGRSLEEPIDLEFSGQLASGGRVRGSGSAALDGRVDLEVKLDGVVLDPAAPYATNLRKLAGAVSGDIRARGPVASLALLSADLKLVDADVELEDMAFRGELGLRADLKTEGGGLSGPFEVDATRAALRYGEFFEKPPGDAATARGRLVPAGGGYDFRDMQLKLDNFEAEVQLRTGARTQLEIDAPPFELAGWEKRVPPLVPLAPQGKLALEKLAIATEPLDVRGRVALPELRLRPEGRPPLTLRGALEGKGGLLQGSGIEALVGGQKATLDVQLTGLATTPRHRLQARVENAEINALLEALAGKRDTMYGPLTAQVDVSGPLGGDQDPVRALTGRSRLDVGRGRLKGVSLLQGTFDRLGALGQAALVAGAQRGGRTLQRFYEDEFESISGSFEIGSGRARTEDLRLVYRHYTVDLRGAIGLADGALDLTGKLTIDEELDAALASAEAPADAAPPPSRKKVIPLAKVGGTAGAPRVELTREAVVAFAATYAAAERRQKLETKIDERLGEGAGKQVIDALEGLLGGRQKR